jgi:hypothetical protein
MVVSLKVFYVARWRAYLAAITPKITQGAPAKGERDEILSEMQGFMNS